MLEMPPLPIKSEMSSTSAAAADSAVLSSLFSVCIPQSQTQLPVQRHCCVIYWIHNLRERDIKHNFSFIFSFSSSSVLLLFLFLLPLYCSSTSTCSFLGFCLVLCSKITADCCVLRGRRQCARWLMFKKMHTHIQTHLCYYFFSEEQQLCLEWTWARHAYRCWENPLCSFILPCSLSLNLVPSASLFTDTVALKPLPFSVGPTNDQLHGYRVPPSPTLSLPLLFLSQCSLYLPKILINLLFHTLKNW